MATSSGDDYANPTHFCDLVMKGGITSGVVYPLAVCELARRYRFKSIGGTSVGAVAAAVAAAAEYGRSTASDDAARSRPFRELAKLPDRLGEPGRLEALFEPDPGLRQVYAVATAAIGKKTTAGILLAVAGQLLRHYWLVAVVIAGLVWAIDWRLLAELPSPTRDLTLVLAVVVGVTAFLVISATALFLRITRMIPDNFYGLTRGFRDGATGDRVPLINWLHAYLNELAGLNPADVLTFGHLFGQPHCAAVESRDAPERAINLEMMTTAVSLGRPYRLPFAHEDRRHFYFDPKDLERLLPKEVVRHMVAKGSGIEPAFTLDNPALVPFPRACDLPVVAAVRMSLSFPLLLSAVRLYAIDEDHRNDEGQVITRRCWFSDGGICSNLPIHFFDSPLPRWPTFGINLTQASRNGRGDAVRFPPNHDTALPSWLHLEDPDGRGLVSNFLLSILDTMQNWQDNTQSRLPGYRDRLVEVTLAYDEGGLNLKMDPDTVKSLSSRGRRAGEMLVQRFAPSEAPPRPAAAWAQHRWDRFRSSMELTCEWMERLAERYHFRAAPDQPFDDLVRRAPGEAPVEHPLRDLDHEPALTTVEAIIRAVSTWDGPKRWFPHNAPTPKAELRNRPKV